MSPPEDNIVRFNTSACRGKLAAVRVKVPMSALGQKPPKADIRQHDWHVRFVPKADIMCAAID
jgi:hypothetical protein